MPRLHRPRLHVELALIAGGVFLGIIIAVSSIGSTLAGI